MSQPINEPMNESMAVAIEAAEGLRRAGVTDVVLAPGSRSAALALVLHQADSNGVLRLHVRIDERTAGFLALGLAKGGHRPVAVVTTSGTAVANLHPAVLEATHAGVPLIVLSADRPAALRGTGANQTTDQRQMFGDQVASHDLKPGDTDGVAHAIASAAGRSGPTQINVQFADPLVPESLPLPLQTGESPGEQGGHADGPPRRRWDRADAPPAEQIALGPRTVIVAGDDAGPLARMLAQRAGWPLLAEPTSGARNGRNAIRTYRLLLASDLGARVERVVVTGHPTLSRPVTQLISRTDVEVLSVRSSSGVCSDPGRVARHLDVVPEVVGADPSDWLDEWQAADVRLSAEVDRIADEPAGHPLRIGRAVAAAVVPEALLVVGSSQPIRDLDVMTTPYEPGGRRLIVGNRGLAGIDGTVSTAIGSALARRSSRSLAYMGDLTFLHDANALVIGPDEPRPDLTIVVLNDRGGAIFATLEQGARELASAYERVFGTPHDVSIESLCAATGTVYERVADGVDLAAALEREPRGIRVIEAPTTRDGRRDLDARLRALV
ncbi:MAG TPA: 2-succinyl-5-enolpyruvyl-6-hydroxy-3-cyclohexene-1-carboxylic-acid synthase [Nocardioidaceae bacterium]|nr:2-succinyl-5-enolpyruvyl-6-hydroxy-3-cyclohexene-1-carboxylic-acid synthase [Nocardioidaceae bacterium]